MAFAAVLMDVGAMLINEWVSGGCTGVLVKFTNQSRRGNATAAVTLQSTASKNMTYK